MTESEARTARGRLCSNVLLSW